jgi:hypothetical protein
VSDTAVFPVHRFEVDAQDPNRIVLTVHYFATRDDFEKGKSVSTKYLMPASGVAPLADMLDTVLRKLNEREGGIPINPFRKN